MNDTEQRRQKIEKVVKLVALGVIGVIVAPYVLLSIKGLAGLFAAWLIGTGMVAFSPVISRMVANARLKMLKHEAMKNPVETLQNEYRERKELLERQRTAIVELDTETRNFADHAERFAEQYPQEAREFQNKLAKMEQLLEFRRSKLESAETKLEIFKAEISKVDAIWQIAMAAQKLSKRAGVDADAFDRELSERTAIHAVTSNMNAAFADLDQSLREEGDSQNQIQAETPRPQLGNAMESAVSSVRRKEIA